MFGGICLSTAGRGAGAGEGGSQQAFRPPRNPAERWRKASGTDQGERDGLSCRRRHRGCDLLAGAQDPCAQGKPFPLTAKGGWPWGTLASCGVLPAGDLLHPIPVRANPPACQHLSISRQRWSRPDILISRCLLKLYLADISLLSSAESPALPCGQSACRSVSAFSSRLLGDGPAAGTLDELNVSNTAGQASKNTGSSLDQEGKAITSIRVYHWNQPLKKLDPGGQGSLACCIPRGRSVRQD